jgi:hypothetical protein
VIGRRVHLKYLALALVTAAGLNLAIANLAQADLQDATGDYNHKEGTGCYDTSTRVTPMNVVFFDWAQPTPQRSLSHVEFHTDVGGLEWNWTLGAGADKDSWADGSGGCTTPQFQPADHTGFSSDPPRYHMRLYATYCQDRAYCSSRYPTWDVTDIAQVHHEYNCSDGSGHKLYSGYDGLDGARDTIQTIMSTYGSLHTEHWQRLQYWGNTASFKQVCNGTYYVSSDGYVGYSHIPNEAHPGYGT